MSNIEAYNIVATINGEFVELKLLKIKLTRYESYT